MSTRRKITVPTNEYADDIESSSQDHGYGGRNTGVQYSSKRPPRVVPDSCTSDTSTMRESSQKSHLEHDQERPLSSLSSSKSRSKPSCIQNIMRRTPLTLVGFFLFVVFTTASVSIAFVVAESYNKEMEEEALSMAIETGNWFSSQLDRAILPLFSMAQFALHLDMFKDLPSRIGPTGASGSLPIINGTHKRDIRGVCDDPELVDTFVDIATDIKQSAGMDGILVNIQLAPAGVICLLHPMVNTEDFEDGESLNSTSAWGLDLFDDPFMKYIAADSIKQDIVGIAGPRKLTQCPECDPFFIARLPIVDPNNQIVVDGVPYKRYGFATALIAWARLVEESGIYEKFKSNSYEFQLTRTDLNQNIETGEFEEVVVVLAETKDFATLYESGERSRKVVSQTLETTNNQWEMAVMYDGSSTSGWFAIVTSMCVLVSFFLAYLINCVLRHKHMHNQMEADTREKEAKIVTERNMTAYFAHELRNPLSALDSALQAIGVDETLSTDSRELVDSMLLCSSFMSAIMNNLLDVRKLEEGKMDVRPHTLRLSRLIEKCHKMMRLSVRPGVEFLVEKDVPEDCDWVLGDGHRIQQVLTNVVNNAIKYTMEGSITLAVSWKDGMACLECRDTGPGIPKSEQSKLFERFVQRGGAPGTGLGLNISQQIVRLMNGSIQFISDPTVKPGTTCRILLPLEPCQKPEELNPSKQLEVCPIEEKINVMIIDDIKMNRNMLKRRIEKSIAPNANIIMATTGEEAMHYLKRVHDVHVIVCDQYMEQAGGLMLGTDAIIAMRRNKVNAFIIGCSGNDLDKDFFDAGADIVWGKPMPSNADIIDQWREGLRDRNLLP